MRVFALVALTLALAACGSVHSAAPTPVKRLKLQPVAAHTRVVDKHGIEVTVPAAWRLNQETCGTPQANTVLLDDGSTLCAVREPPGLSVVEFDAPLAKPRAWYARHAPPIRIDGVPAYRMSASAVAPANAMQLYFPGRDVSVTVFSPDRSLVRRILASVRVVNADENGCPSRMPSGGYRLGSQPTRGARFVPAGVVRVSACAYVGPWLDGSNRLGRRGAARLAQALNAAPFGVSRPPSGMYAPDICGSSWRGSRIVARFEYAHGRPPVVVTAHLDGCSRLGASNGRWTVRMTERWVWQLVGDSRYGGDVADPFLP